MLAKLFSRDAEKYSRSLKQHSYLLMSEQKIKMIVNLKKLTKEYTYLNNSRIAILAGVEPGYCYQKSAFLISRDEER